MDISRIIEGFLIFGPPLTIAIVVHEVAHAWAADKLGDPTARQLGRITLNPIKHIDPFMSLLLPAMLIISGSPVVFGGAKPVPFNPYNLGNPKRDSVLIAAAGPASNFILAIIFFCLYSITAETLQATPNKVMALFFVWFFQSILINIVLALFNLFPVPPLDGGRIVTGLLPRELSIKYASLEPYGFLILVAAIYFGVFEAYLGPVITWLIGSLL